MRANFLFESEDLENWTYLHPFVEDDAFTLVGDDGACPYFWPIGDRHILLFFGHMSGGQYLLGDYDTERDKFVVTNGGKFNFGAARPSGVHAPSATPDGEGGVVVIFNMNSGKPKPAQRWNQIMTLPRRLRVSGDEIAIEPAGDLESLRDTHQHFEALELPANREVVLDSVSGNTLELIAEIDTGAPMLEMNVLRSPNREEYTRIAFFHDRGFSDRGGGTPRRQSLVTIDNSHSSCAPDVLSRAPETAPVYLADDERLELRVFIDRSVVEVFVNGRQCVAVRVYPERSDSLGVSFRSQGTTSSIHSLDAWRMRSIW